ncbi:MULTISPECIES: hypothetical protein [unclassified Methylophilus]|uniref:hypothetical protein n=1 Tax=unclassified Methylophilus TaxID=2630143 RepID=UPI001E5C3C8B|nr:MULTISPECIES: hypothetical protein [unclassified Methylophilus]
MPKTWDAINLQINKTGTFRWRLNGCDYNNGGNGTWKTVEDMLILEPRESYKLNWIGKNLSFDVKEVRLSTRNNDEIHAEIITFKESEKTLVDDPQIWKRGRVCAQCGGFIGPTAPPKFCTEDN